MNYNRIINLNILKFKLVTGIIRFFPFILVRDDEALSNSNFKMNFVIYKKYIYIY